MIALLFVTRITLHSDNNQKNKIPPKKGGLHSECLLSFLPYSRHFKTPFPNGRTRRSPRSACREIAIEYYYDILLDCICQIFPRN